MSLTLRRTRVLTPSTLPFRPNPTLTLPLVRTFATTLTPFSPPYPANMPAPPKKMYHLEAINSIPSQYPEFRNVLWTGESSQLVVMTVPVGGDIGEEVGRLPHLCRKRSI